MRIAKPLLMFSLSVFLLAASWSLLTGQLGSVGPAHAQAQEVYTGPPLIYFSMSWNTAEAVDEEGWGWTWNDGMGWNRIGTQMFAPGTPIPTGTQSMGSFKAQTGGN